MTYSVKCDCGDVITADAESREAAVEALKTQWGPEAVASHYADKHPGQPVPSQDQVHAMIEQGAQESAPAASEASSGEPMGEPASEPTAEPVGGEAPASGDTQPQS